MNSSAPRPDKSHSDLIFLSAADARRIEAAEEYGALRYAQSMQDKKLQPPAAWEQFGGGHLVFVAKGFPVGRAHGLGFAGKITLEDIEYVERFYFDRGIEAQVDVSPYADASLFESLNSRGFQVAEFNQTLARRIEPSEDFPAPPSSVKIRRVREQEAREWSTLLAGIYFAPDIAPQYEDLFLPWVSRDDALALAAFVDDKMVAGAGGLIVPEHRMAGLFGAATLPEYRGRGIQKAFMHERLRLVQQAGCDLAVTLTMPGTTSQRNVERAGFRVAYTKVVVKKVHPSVAGAGPVQPLYST